jgi:hypothetical protein
LLTRLGAGDLHGQGLGQGLGADGANENVDARPAADVTATANNVNGEGEIFLNALRGGMLITDEFFRD